MFNTLNHNNVMLDLRSAYNCITMTPINLQCGGIVNVLQVTKVVENLQEYIDQLIEIFEIFAKIFKIFLFFLCISIIA